MDLKLSNQVFNALKQHSISEQRKSARVHDKKEVSTAVSLTPVCLYVLLLMCMLFVM